MFVAFALRFRWPSRDVLKALDGHLTDGRLHVVAAGDVILRLAKSEMAFAGESENRLSAALEGRDVLRVGLDPEDKVLQHATDLEGGLGA